MTPAVSTVLTLWAWLDALLLTAALLVLGWKWDDPDRHHTHDWE